MSEIRPPKNAELLTAALDIAVKYHRGQFREGAPLPYLTHSLGVLKRLTRWGLTDDVPYVGECAILHDVPEEAFEFFAACSEIHQRVGGRQHDIVMELTFQWVSDAGTPKHVQKANYMASFGGKSIESNVIKVADRLENTEDFEDSKPDYAPKYLGKAARLFEIVGARRSEVVQVFGEQFYENMLADIIRVHKRLGAGCPVA